ncbi:MAG: flagellar biosynthesis protein FlhB [Planctomycetota bacterium]
MALFRDDQGRTEKPTPSRLNEVREKGDTHLSKEMLGSGVLVMVVIALRSCGGWLVDSIEQMLRRGLDLETARRMVDEGSLAGAVATVTAAVAHVAAPLGVMMGLLFVGCLAFGYGQIGLRISKEVLAFKLERVNPVANWSKVFNFQAIVRTGFAALKLGLLSAVLYLVLKNRWSSLTLLHEMPVTEAARQVADVAMLVLQVVAAVVFVLAIADVFYQRFDFQQRNMMTKQEVEDERKRSEGDPLVKSRMRGARMELLKHRMMEAVPKADVVIANPTHFAVAISYDRRKNAAPEVVAKGMDAMALRIRELAEQNDVPVMEDPPLARALYRAVRVGQEIPARFYQAVATVLSHVYRMKGRVA